MASTRILALHGSGTNAAIWKAQSGTLANMLPRDWTYEYLEGTVICNPAEGIDAVYPAPYFCYYDIPTLENVEAAHNDIYEMIQEQGPFDGVFGFSQGAALAASILLHRQIEQPFSPPLFRFAVFFCGTLPFSKSRDMGMNLSHMWTDDHIGNRAVFTPQDDDSGAAGSTEDPPLDKSDPTYICRFSPRSQNTRIEVPTAHVYGKRDPFLPQSLRLLELCDSRSAMKFEHQGGHDAPRGQEALRAAAQVILRTFERAQFVSS